MLLERVYDEDLAQASYLIGSERSREAVVVDPRRDIDVYLDLARTHRMSIVAVTETHIHADYLSGARELAAATGASLYLSAEGGAQWQYGFDHKPLRHGDEFSVGDVTLRVLHTPGHTPEHLSFLVIDRSVSDQPGHILTGDFVFVSDLGRPDLQDEAAGARDTRFELAPLLFRSLRDRFLPLPEFIQVWPGHGAGSACGKSLGAVPTSTVGFEKLTSWWAPFVLDNDEAGFVEVLLDGQPDAPRYFGRMKRLNRDGPALLGELPKLDEANFEDLPLEDVQLVDVRSRKLYSAGHVAGSLNIPAARPFATYASWVLDPERDNRPIYLLGAGRELAHELRNRLLRIGVDNVAGFVTEVPESAATGQVRAVTPQELQAMEDVFVLDVRSASEFAAGHIPGATQIHGGRAVWQLERIPGDRPVVVHCLSGARSAVVASALTAAGFDNVHELDGSFRAWREANLPVATASELETAAG